MPYYIQKKKSKSPRSSKSTAVAAADKAFSAYIRLRDAMPSGYFRCISCGQIKPFASADCGHFWSRRHMATRFCEDNAHAECSACNRFVADHLATYQVNLIRKIGQTRFDLLAVKKESVCHYTEAELREIAKFYKEQAKKLSSLKQIRVKI